MQKFGLDAVACAALLILACSGHQTKLAATGSGDLSNPLAARTAFNAELKAACGDGHELAETPALRRKPYLQHITEESARVLFTARNAAEFTVKITRPDGSVVSEAPAARAPNIVPPGAEAQYEARISGLEPDTVYCYSVQGITERTGFRTAPAPQSQAPVRFIAFGDSGTGDRYQRAVAEQLTTVAYDLALHMGDIAYGSGQPDELEQFFFDVYAPMIQNVAVFPISGNHDYKTANAQPMLNAFALPETAPPELAERFYSFDWGNIHFVGLDTELMSPIQAAWLDADLSANTREWKIVFAHRPPYSSGEHGSSQTFRKVFGPVLAKHKVPLVLSGHEHNYERTHPINGTTYIVTGGGGRETREVEESSFTAYAEGVLHFLYVEVTGPTLVLHAIDGVGREFDSKRIDL